MTKLCCFNHPPISHTFWALSSPV